MLHAMVTLLFAAAGWLCHIPALAWLCAAFYVGREHTQAEYRWIDAYGGGRRDAMPWWGGFDPRVWNCKSLLDWLLPVCAALLAEAV